MKILPIFEDKSTLLMHIFRSIPRKSPQNVETWLSDLYCFVFKLFKLLLLYFFKSFAEANVQ